MLKPLDIVKTNNGDVGLITESKSNTKDFSIKWFGESHNKNAWWTEGEDGLKAIDNLAKFLTDGLRHPFSSHDINPYR